MTLVTVPAGEVWLIKFVSIDNPGALATNTRLAVLDAANVGATLVSIQAGAGVPGTFAPFQPMVLMPGDRLRAVSSASSQVVTVSGSKLMV